MKIKIRKLKGSIKKVTTKGKVLNIDLKSLQVFGVSKERGIEVTGRAIGKDLSKYYYFKGQKFAYNPYRANIGSIGLTNSNFRGLISPAYVVFEVDNTIHSDFLLTYLKSPFGLNEIRKYGNRGGVRSSLRFSDLEKIDFPDISFEKQESFMANYDRKFKHYRKLESEYKDQIKYIDELRESIFDDAITGKLTRKWRERNKDITPAKKMLDKLIEYKDTVKGRNRNQTIIQAKSFKIPSTWGWCNLDDIVSIVSGVTKGKKNKEELISVEYLRVANVQRGYIDLNEIKKILVTKYDYNKYQLKLNDLLIIEGGDRDKVGRCAIWKYEIPDCIYQNHVYRVRPYLKDSIDEYFLMTMLNSSHGRNYFSTNAKQTTNLASINKTVVSSFSLPLPPFEEQRAITINAKELLSNCDYLEKEAIKNIENSQKILNASLVELLGEDIPTNKITTKVIENKANKRKIIFDSKTTNMDLVEIIEKHGEIHAEDLWKMSKFPDNIDKFYAELKHQIEIKNSIKEVVNKKGYLELV